MQITVPHLQWGRSAGESREPVPLLDTLMPLPARASGAGVPTGVSLPPAIWT